MGNILYGGCGNRGCVDCEPQYIYTTDDNDEAHLTAQVIAIVAKPI